MPIGLFIFASAVCALGAMLLLRSQPAGDERMEDYWLQMAGSSLRGGTRQARSDGFLDRIGLGRGLRVRLVHADVKLQPLEFTGLLLAIGLMLALVIGVVLRANPLTAAVLGFLVALIGGTFYLQSRRDRYITTLVTQLPQVVQVMSGALRAGLSVRQAIESVAAELPAPAGLEFAGISQQLRLGLSLDEALESAAERVPVTEMRILTTTLLVQRQTGGNLPRALDSLAQTMRARQHLQDEIRVGTASAKLQTRILLLMPFFLLAIWSLLSANLRNLLFHSPVGLIIILFYVLYEAACYVVVRRVVRVPV